MTYNIRHREEQRLKIHRGIQRYYIIWLYIYNLYSAASIFLSILSNCLSIHAISLIYLEWSIERHDVNRLRLPSNKPIGIRKTRFTQLLRQISMSVLLVTCLWMSWLSYSRLTANRTFIISHFPIDFTWKSLHRFVTVRLRLSACQVIYHIVLGTVTDVQVWQLDPHLAPCVAVGFIQWHSDDHS